MIKRIQQISFLILILSIFSGCQKLEGYGGKSVIYGKVLERNYDNSGQLLNEYYLPEKRVYIIFGDEDFYGDDVRTDFEGKYKFSFLYAGNYTIFTYSECNPADSCDADIKDVKIEINVLNNGDVVYGNDLITENW